MELIAAVACFVWYCLLNGFGVVAVCRDTSITMLVVRRRGRGGRSIMRGECSRQPQNQHHTTGNRLRRILWLWGQSQCRITAFSGTSDRRP